MRQNVQFLWFRQLFSRNLLWLVMMAMVGTLLHGELLAIDVKIEIDIKANFGAKRNPDGDDPRCIPARRGICFEKITIGLGLGNVRASLDEDRRHIKLRLTERPSYNETIRKDSLLLDEDIMLPQDISRALGSDWKLKIIAGGYALDYSTDKLGIISVNVEEVGNPPVMSLVAEDGGGAVAGALVGSLAGGVGALPGAIVGGCTESIIKGVADLIDKWLGYAVLPTDELPPNTGNPYDSVGIKHNRILRDYFARMYPYYKTTQLVDFLEENKAKYGLSSILEISEIEKIINHPSPKGTRTEDYVEYYVSRLPADIDTVAFSNLMTDLISSYEDHRYILEWHSKAVTATNEYLKTLDEKNQPIMGSMLSVFIYSTAFWSKVYSAEKPNSLVRGGIIEDFFKSLVDTYRNGVTDGGCVGGGWGSLIKLITHKNSFNLNAGNPVVDFDKRNPYDSAGYRHNKILSGYLESGKTILSLEEYYDFIIKNQTTLGIKNPLSVAELDTLFHAPTLKDESIEELLSNVHRYLPKDFDTKEFDKLLEKILSAIDENNPKKVNEFIIGEGSDYLATLDSTYKPIIGNAFSVMRWSTWWWWSYHKPVKAKKDKARIVIGFGEGRNICTPAFSLCTIDILPDPKYKEVIYDREQTVWAYVDDEYLHIDFTEQFGALDTALVLSSDMWVDFAVSNMLGLEESALKLKAGSYTIDKGPKIGPFPSGPPPFNPYGTIKIPYITSKLVASCYPKSGKLCDKDGGTCLVMFPRDKESKQIPFVITSINSDTLKPKRASIEFLSKLAYEGPGFMIEDDLELGDDLSKALGGTSLSIVKDIYSVNYSRNRNGYIEVELVEKTSSVEEDAVMFEECVSQEGSRVTYFDVLGKEVDSSSILKGQLYLKVVYCGNGVKHIFKVIGN